MSDNRHYWNRKHERMEQAKEHVIYVNKTYAKEVENSKRETIIYMEDHDFSGCGKNSGNPKMVFSNEDSVSAIFHLNPDKTGKIAVLNFASFKEPGGFFLAGSSAQEECLCMESTLYNVLTQFEKKYYEPNHKALNKALYKDRALYSPEIIFDREGKVAKVDVITCAAPNKATAQRYQSVSDIENHAVLLSRLKFLRNIAEENCVDTIVLGAWGCGVFGQDPKEVATLIKNTFKDSPLKYVILAVLGNDATAKEFQSVFSTK